MTGEHTDVIYLTNMKILRVMFYLILLVLSVIVTEVVAVIDSIQNNTFTGGGLSGFPLQFSSSANLFGGGRVNSTNLLLDILFWFVVLFLIWKLLKKIVFKR